MKSLIGVPPLLRALTLIASAALAPVVFGQQVTFAPYIQLGDSGSFGPTDQIVVAWQTDTATTNAPAYKVEFHSSAQDSRTITPKSRVVDNYLAADPALPTIPGAYGAHSNYYAVLSGLKYDTDYTYTVSGPGMAAGGFTATFHTRTQSPIYSFVVEGDEGFFPTVPNENFIVDYAARIAHLVNNAGNISLINQPTRPAPQFILNTGDNVYNEGTEDNYRDFFFPVYNSDQDSNENGAPILRSKLFFIVPGNHDLGSTGVNVNMLADNSAPAFSGNLSGGDALSYFNDFYYPLNGPKGFDILYQWNGDTNKSIANGMLFSYQGHTYNSPAAITAFRDSTAVDTGNGTKLQINHQSNYSFDYGNAHFLFLDANPHLFNDNSPGGNAFNSPPPTFSSYPSALGQWVINDLDSSKQTWKIVVYHQPAFSSGDSTIVNGQMRAVAKLLEDHGVNFVFNGHEHNYQRTHPIRSTSRTGNTPTTAGAPLVTLDEKFDGSANTVPDGVLYMVEGAGGNRDFDGDYAPPRGSGVGLDQDDSATGTFTDEPGLTVPQGPASWLDTNLTNPEMINFVPNAGSGPKITVKFKSKVFSFGHVVVDRNKFTLYQISEPLQATSSATSAEPAPFGTDINGQPLNDPIPDTQVDPTSGKVISAPATGQSSLLDKWTVVKPQVGDTLLAEVTAPAKASAGGAISYKVTVKNHSPYGLTGTQVRLKLPSDVTFAGTAGNTLSVFGSEVVVSLGHLDMGAEQTIEIPATVATDATKNAHLTASAEVTSSTALSVTSNNATSIVQ